MAIRSPCGSTKPKSNPLGEYEKHYEVALSTTTLPGFSAGTRIAAPVCALVRNDMLKEEACARVQGRLVRKVRRNLPGVSGCKDVGSNDMLFLHCQTHTRFCAE